jgi:hypothetical protein
MNPLVHSSGQLFLHPSNQVSKQSFIEPCYAGLDFVRQNPPPVRLPGANLFTLPLDYRPDEEAVKRCKYWTGWKVGCTCCYLLFV